jgi:hypothetical protein
MTGSPSTTSESNACCTRTASCQNRISSLRGRLRLSAAYRGTEEEAPGQDKLGAPVSLDTIAQWPDEHGDQPAADAVVKALLDTVGTDAVTGRLPRLAVGGPVRLALAEQIAADAPGQPAPPVLGTHVHPPQLRGLTRGIPRGQPARVRPMRRSPCVPRGRGRHRPVPLVDCDGKAGEAEVEGRAALQFSGRLRRGTSAP